MKILGIALIRIYQWCISPMIGNVCRFHPSCSHYAVEALQEHGFWLGCWLAFKRILRCQPWSEGGHDPVPNKTDKH